MNQKAMEKREAQWRAESDARTLAESERIKSDENRLKAAQKAANDMAKSAKEELDAFERIKDPKNQIWIGKK